jgi:hypothetical protein
MRRFVLASISIVATALVATVGAVNTHATAADPPPTAATQTRPQVPYEQMIAAVTDLKNMSVAPVDVPKAFAAFGPFKQDGGNGSMVVVSERKPWGALQIDYQQDEKNVWRVQGFDFYLPIPNGELPAFGALFEGLRSKLGKPFKIKKEKGSASAAAWKLSKRQRVFLWNKRDSLPGESLIQPMTVLSAGPETEQFED